jgi:acyl-CoA hydrolase
MTGIDEPDRDDDGTQRTVHHSQRMTILMTPDMANFTGNVHGGAILKMLDHVA